MAKNNNLTDFLTGVANAIRTKKGKSGLINPQDFESEIAGITTSGTQKEEQEKSVTVTENGTTEITPDDGKALSKVSVTTNVKPKLQTKTITPSTSEQNATPDSGYDGLNKVTVNAVPTEIKNATPTKSSQTITPSSGKFLSAVTVNPIPDDYVIPTGDVNITENGSYDVSGKANAVVNVAEAKPEQEKTITINANGTTEITPDDGKALSKATVIVNVPQTITAIEEVATAEAMSALLIASNVGKAYKFTGTTDDTYTNGDIYEVASGIKGNLGSLAVGSKVKIHHSVIGDIIFRVVDKNHDGYPENSVTLMTDEIILCRCLDAKEPNNSDSDRAQYGNNKYSVSNLDQWLNSTAAAGQWYSARHSADQSPSNDYVVNEYDQDAGFLAGFDAAFIAALKDTTLIVTLNTLTDGGGYESITRKFFLPSDAEIFGRAENGIMEGSFLSYFSENTAAVRIAKISAYAAAHNVYTTVIAGNNGCYWLRTPDTRRSYPGTYVNDEGGAVFAGTVSGNVGVRPLCNLGSGVTISSATDSDGCYSLSSTPVISFKHYSLTSSSDQVAGQ